MNKPYINKLIGLACFILAACILYLVVQGLMTGEILKMSKSGREVISKVAQPERFWLNIGFWTLGVVLSLVTAIKKLCAPVGRQ